MPSLKDIRVRIESTKNTQQITKAMKLVSAAKLRKAQHQITNMRPYALSLLNLMANVATTQRVEHPLLQIHAQKNRVLIVVLTSDRGLCGSFNSQIIRFAEQTIAEASQQYENVDLLVVGRKGVEFFQRRGIKPVEVITKLDKDVSYALAAKTAEKMMKQFVSGSYDEVKVVYNEFKSAISQKPVAETIFPVDLSRATPDEEGKLSFSKDIIFEPDPKLIMDQLLTKHFSIQMYRCMAESVAAEHGARMTAMENATNNAKEVMSKLTLTYNKLRQEKITTELTEIVSGSEALN